LCACRKTKRRASGECYDVAQSHARREKVDLLMSENKNPHAVALGRLGGHGRAESLSAEELSEIGRMGGLKGGLARAKALSSSERTEIARKAGKARLTKLSKAERSRIAAQAAQARWKKKA
jgi:hypothetical protein